MKITYDDMPEFAQIVERCCETRKRQNVCGARFTIDAR